MAEARCGNCQYFEPNAKKPPWGDCLKIGEWIYSARSGDSRDDPSVKACVTEGALLTRDDFGCVLHEPKTLDVTPR